MTNAEHAKWLEHLQFLRDVRTIGPALREYLNESDEHLKQFEALRLED